MSEARRHVDHLVDDYLHDLLDADTALRVEEHCSSCPHCRGALDEARHRLQALRAVPPVEAGPELVESTLGRIESRPASRRGRWRLLAGLVGALAAGVLVLAGCLVYYSRMKATPYDLLVLGQNRLLAATSNALRLRLVDRDTDQPMAGIPVSVELLARDGSRSTQLASFTTDANGAGQPRFTTPDWPDGEYQIRVTAQTPEREEVLTRPVELKRSWKVMLSSDKPVYQPGQTIHVRALALRRPDLKPVAEQPAVFSVMDPRGNVLFKQAGPTSKFGITAVDCPLATEILEGPYVVACKVGDTETRLSVEVQKYVLPKFKIVARLDRSFYGPGETASYSLQADYFFGKPVADAEVDVRVFTRDFALRQVHQQTLRTDAGGKASLTFTVPPNLAGRPQDGGDARLVVQAQVKDRAGQEQLDSLERVVTTQPVRVEVLPEAGTLVRDVPNRVYLLVTRADGSPVQARVTVSGLLEELRSSSLGVASFEITPRQDQVRWTFSVLDDQRKVLARKNVTFACGATQPDFLLRTDRAVYRGGDSMTLTVLGGGKEPVFVDFIREGEDRQLVLSETIDLEGGKGKSVLDLPADLFGTLRIYAYRFGPDGLVLHKARAVYVHPPGEVKIKAVLDHEEYRPGTKAKVRFQLTGKDGKAAPGALSLAAVDEAVFHVLGQKPGMEKTFYTLEKELLEPVYAIYPWSLENGPGQRGPEQESLELALFSATAGSRTVTPRDMGQDAEARGPRTEAEDAPVMAMPVPEGRIQPSVDRTARVSIPVPHTLSVASFQEKVRSLQDLKRTASMWIFRGYVTLAVLGLLTGYLALWLFIPVRDLLKIHAAALAILVPLGLMFALVRVSFDRSAPRGEQAMTFAGGEAEMAKSAPPGMMDGGPRAMEDRMPAPEAVGLGQPPEDLEKGLQDPPRVRREFPETLLWKPQLITDDQGQATLDLALADSITTWRLSASAVSAGGKLGSAQLPVKVFQPFFVDLNLPVALTRNDEAAIPVVVYNYLDRAQKVTLTLREEPWLELLEGDAERTLDLGPGEVKAIRYRLKVTKVGTHGLEVMARGMDMADALRREIAVEPDGRRVELASSGALTSPVEMALSVPDDAIEGSAHALVKIYPSAFSQLVEGLENIFRMPYGCFEQTSSTTYPNVLALDYLRSTRQSAPQVEAKARQYIHLGYQRLVSFEVSGGGFDWFGRPPANRTLTAYGLMEFQDMARVHDVDPALIGRTRRWLLAQRQSDGSWDREGHGLHDDPTARGNGEQARLATTAYIAWAVFSAPEAANDIGSTRDFLLSHRPEGIKDANVLALVCNALLAMKADPGEVTPYLARLDAMKKTAEDGRHAYWDLEAGSRTTFHGSGRAGSVEATALAVLALLESKQHPATARGALAWLITQKDAQGTWHSTQATVLTLKALLTAASATFGGEKERRFEVRLGDQKIKDIVITPDQAEVLQMVDLTPHLKPGRQMLALEEKTDTGSAYQVTFRYHVPGELKKPAEEGPLHIELSYNRTELAVSDVLNVTATVGNRMGQAAPMVMLDLPIPGGFALQTDDLQRLVSEGRIARFQVQPRKVLVYLRDLAPGKPLVLGYTLRATMPVKVTAPGARVYEYYAPERQGRSPAVSLKVE